MMEPRVSAAGKKLHISYEIEQRVRCSSLLSSNARDGASIIATGHDDGLTILWRGAYEDEEEQESIHDTLEIRIDQGVTKIAVLEVPEQRGKHARSVKVVIATLGGRIQLLSIPLQPPIAHESPDIEASILENAVMLKTSASYIRSIAAKAIQADGLSFTIAAVSDQLELWQVPDDTVSEDDIQYQVITISKSLTRIAFHPSSQSAQILVTDKLGSVSVYDLAADESSDRWLYTLLTSFESMLANLPTRKRLIDAQFILDGRAILALTHDGQWGIWDTTAAQSSKTLDQFVLSGYLDSAAAAMPANSSSEKRTTSALTPMTPNTRKTKSENFFSAPSTRKEIFPAGGITVSRATTPMAVPDESVMLWYQGGIYTIPSVQAFWQRSTSGAGGFGSLHTPGIASVLSVNLFNESITSLSQLAASDTASGIGQLKVQRDFVVSTEHRLIVVQSRAAAPLFAPQGLSQLDGRDQRMLDAGVLDIGGVDRLLDDLSSRGRKVGFAH